MADIKDIIDNAVKETVDDIITKVMSEIRQKNSKSLQTKIYKDEPILTTASRLDSYVPKEILDMQKIATSYDAYTHSMQWLFYTQGKAMESFEDDYEYSGEFVKYFPTYQSLNTRQLRGYFSWRTRVRQGDIRKTLLSFVFLYIYELLNMIGVSSPQEGFDRLKELQTAYAQIDSSVDRHLRKWLADYIVYYNMDKSLLGDNRELQLDDCLITLINHADKTEEELFNAMSGLSSYSIERSGFYKKYPEDVRRVACGVFTALSDYYSKHGKKSLIEKLFGVKFTARYNMFENAVFYDRLKFSGYEYAMNDIRVFRRTDGMWFCERYVGGKSSRLGDLLKTIDALMRVKYEYKVLLKEEKATKLVLSVIDKEISALLEEKKEKERLKIEIDVGKLVGIRRAAEETKAKLIVDDEDEFPDIPSADIQETKLFTETENSRTEPLSEDAQAVTEAVSDDIPLDDTEREFLKCLLDGRPFGEVIRSGGRMLSIVADSVNEKLFDIFGDTVIAFDGDSPVLIDDYTDELKGLIGE